VSCSVLLVKRYFGLFPDTRSHRTTLAVTVFIDRYTDTQTDRQKDKQTEKHTNIDTDKQTDTQTDTQTDSLMFDSYSHLFTVSVSK